MDGRLGRRGADLRGGARAWQRGRQRPQSRITA